MARQYPLKKQKDQHPSLKGSKSMVDKKVLLLMQLKLFKIFWSKPFPKALAMVKIWSLMIVKTSELSVRRQKQKIQKEF
jgi:hypothetical protein